MGGVGTIGLISNLGRGKYIYGQNEAISTMPKDNVYGYYPIIFIWKGNNDEDNAYSLHSIPGVISYTMLIFLLLAQSFFVWKKNMSKLREVPVTIRMQPKIVQTLTASNLACWACIESCYVTCSRVWLCMFLGGSVPPTYSTTALQRTLISAMKLPSQLERLRFIFNHPSTSPLGNEHLVASIGVPVFHRRYDVKPYRTIVHCFISPNYWYPNKPHWPDKINSLSLITY